MAKSMLLLALVASASAAPQGLASILGGLFGGSTVPPAPASSGAAPPAASSGLSGILGLLGSLGGSLGGGSSASPCSNPMLLITGGEQAGHCMGEPEMTDILTGVASMAGKDMMPSLSGAFVNGAYGPVAAPAGAAPKRVVLQSRIDIAGSQTVKVRYGPFNVPGATKKNKFGQAGMLANWPARGLEKPCTGDCTIMGMNAGLEYVDGSNANINTGLWLHHMVLFNVGANRTDYPCSVGRAASVPHYTIGATAQTSERIFASGNERTVGLLPEWGVKDAGYKLKSTDTFAALVELMNMNQADKLVFLTMTYDIVPNHPFKDDIKIVWFDVRQCGTSEVNPPKGKNQFVLDYTWTAAYDGEVVGAIGHLHDGGDKTQLLVDGKLTCDNGASYGGKPEFVNAPMDGAMAGGHSHGGATKHISDMTICHGKSVPYPHMRKGQKWQLKAFYDFDKNPGMKHENGAWDEVMGIEIMFVRRKNSV